MKWKVEGRAPVAAGSFARDGRKLLEIFQRWTEVHFGFEAVDTGDAQTERNKPVPSQEVRSIGFPHHDRQKLRYVLETGFGEKSTHDFQGAFVTPGDQLYVGCVEFGTVGSEESIEGVARNDCARSPTVDLKHHRDTAKYDCTHDDGAQHDFIVLRFVFLRINVVETLRSIITFFFSVVSDEVLSVASLRVRGRGFPQSVTLLSACLG